MHVRAGVLSAALSVLSVGFGQAQSGDVVTLKSFDGFTQLRGEIVSFDGQNFTISTGLGVVTVDALQVECEGAACPSDLLFNAKFGIYGSNTIGAELMPALVEGYADKLEARLVTELTDVENERVLRILRDDGREIAAIDLRAHGSGTAPEGIASDQAAIGMMSRRIRDNEVRQVAAATRGDPRDTSAEHIIALDGLLLITSQDTPVSAIGLEDAADIFSGIITNWSEVGGPDLPIQVFARDENSGTFDTFQTLVLEPLGEELTPSAQRYESSVELSDTVARTPGAIGFIGAAYARAAKVLKIRQECGLLSEPTPFSIKTEEYPLSRRLYLYASQTGSPPHARSLVDFAISQEAHGIVEDADFISLAKETATLDEQGKRLVHAIIGEDEFDIGPMREMLRELSDAERLTTTFRFQPGSTQLDARSARDVEALARSLVLGEFDGQEVLLIGFTDSIGQFELNRSLALRRAGQVQAQIAQLVGPQTFGQLSIRTLGYGELTPVGCNSTFEGRQINRRVEVWVRNL